jgi:CHASE2 domain-containing sensor protein
MNLPTRDSEVASVDRPAQGAVLTPTWREVASPALSLVCLAHCLGLGLLAPLLPGALALIAENEILEWSLLMATAALAVGLLWRLRSSIGPWPCALAAALSVLGVISLIREWEPAQQAAIIGLSALQVAVLVRRLRRSRRDKRAALL